MASFSAEKMFSYCVLCFLMTAIAIIGDHDTTLLSAAQFSPIMVMWMRAAVDNFTHAAIAGIVWSIVVYPNMSLLIDEILFATFVGSFIDVDHFIAACSLDIKVSSTLLLIPTF
jgi:hypothetical protein